MTRAAPVVLLIDDNEDDVLLMREAFKSVDGGARLDVCVRSIAVVAHLDRGAPPDLILLDINMPVKNGFDVIEDLKAHPEHRRIPVIMFTTSHRPEDRRRALDQGAEDYLTKPAEFAGLVRLVRELVETLTRRAAGTRPERVEGPRPNGGSCGFTLIELLVAVLIIGMLASTLMNRLHQSILKARRAAMIHYMGEDVRPAMNEYYMKHGQFPQGTGTSDPTVVLKAEGYIAQTFTEKSVDVELNMTGQYFSGTLLVNGGSYWYAWCILQPVAVEFDLPCGVVRPSGLELTAALTLPGLPPVLP